MVRREGGMPAGRNRTLRAGGRVVLGDEGRRAGVREQRRWTAERCGRRVRGPNAGIVLEGGHRYTG